MIESHHENARLGTTSLLLGAALTIAGGLYVAIAHFSSHVSDKLYRAPLSHNAFLISAVFAAATHLLILFGVLALRRRPDLRRAGRGLAVGLMGVVVATALLFICEFLTMPLVDAAESSGWSSVVDTLFGVATLLATAGILVAGISVRRAGIWPMWATRALLACGILNLIAIPIQFTPVFGFAIAVYGLGYALLGFADVRTNVSGATRLAANPRRTEFTRSN
jgi:hypothetical protein